jgi:hypothetical protein
MRPRDAVLAWVDAFNREDVGTLAVLYHADAINHQVAESPVRGVENIRAMFKAGFDTAEMVASVKISLKVAEAREPRRRRHGTQGARTRQQKLLLLHTGRMISHAGPSAPQSRRRLPWCWSLII